MTAPAETTVTITTPNDREIRIERIFDAPRDLVWKAFTDRTIVPRWWARGNEMTVERMELHPGGYWRYVERHSDGEEGFEGRYREIVPSERIVATFEWDGMPGHVAVETVTFDDLGDGRTKMVTTSLFHTDEERDGMISHGMEKGLNQSYAALDKVLAEMTESVSQSTE